MYWGKEKVPPPPFKMENQKPFSLPRLPYRYDASNIETTAYALLVYVSRQELMIDSIVKWINAQRLTDGGWASTQVSFIVGTSHPLSSFVFINNYTSLLRLLFFHSC